MYIPKNKIKTNLYTRGDEYQNISTGINYTGYYWKMYDGKIYTGKNPNEKPTVELIDIESNMNKQHPKTKYLNNMLIIGILKLFLVNIKI